MRLAGGIAVLLGAVALGGCVSSEEPGAAPVVTSADDPGFTEAGAGVKVPKVVGASYGKARDLLRARKLPAALDEERDPKGCRVADQLPESGDVVEPRTPVTLTLSCGAADWEQRRGEDWDAFRQAYETAFREGCARLFALAPPGALTEQPGLADTGTTDTADGYDEPGCEDALDEPEDPPATAPKDPAGAGETRGRAAGCDATFDRAGRDTLYAEGRAVRVADCLSGTTRTGATGTTDELETPAVEDDGVDLATWRTYDRAAKLRAVEAFTADHPDDCLPGPTNAEQVLYDADLALEASGDDTTRVYDVLLTTCKAATG